MQKVISITATNFRQRDFYLNALQGFFEDNEGKIVVKNFFHLVQENILEQVLTLSQLSKQREAFNIIRESYNEVIERIKCRTVASVIILQPSPFELGCWFPDYVLFSKNWGLTYMSENDVRFNLDYVFYFSDRPDYRKLFSDIMVEINPLNLKAYFQKHLRIRKSKRDYGFKVINFNQKPKKVEMCERFLTNLIKGDS